MQPLGICPICGEYTELYRTLKQNGKVTLRCSEDLNFGETLKPKKEDFIQES